MRVAITATASRRELALGIRATTTPDRLFGRRTLIVDVDLEVVGTAAAAGYALEPQRALPAAWWGDTGR